MAFVIADRVRESSVSTGTGNFTLGGAVTGYQTFASALSNGDTTYYTIADQGGANWEVGIGTFTSPSTLARTTILSSSNGGSVVTFGAGTKDVFISLPASKTNVEDQPNLIEVNSSSAALRITQTGAGNALLVEDSANPDSTPFVIDQFGAVVVGGTSSSSATISGSNQFAMVGTTAAGAKQGLSRWDNSTGPFSVQFAKSRSGAIGTQTVVSSGDSIAQLEFFGSDGTAFIEAARITAAVDGTPGTNDMPGRLVFNTTADGASTPTERMRIDSSGNIGIGTSSLTGYNLRVTKSLTGAVTSRALLVQPTVQSDVTTGTYVFQSIATTAAASFTLSNLFHYSADQSALGAGSAVTTQIGFLSASSLLGATANYAFYADNTAAVTAGKTAYGFYSAVNTATGGGTTWGFYAGGTAANYFNGNVGIGTTTLGSKLTVNGDVAGTFFVNPTTVSANYTIPTNYNAMTAGPITVASGAVVTVPSGSTWTVV